MLIGINGKIGSGKDTVAKIIQFKSSQYIQEVIGKDNIIPFIKDELKLTIGQHLGRVPQIKKYAEPLKKIICILIGCTMEDLENQEFKNTPLGPQWKNSEGVELTPRTLLQTVGTECGRNLIHPNIWVNALFNQYTTYPSMTFSYGQYMCTCNKCGKSFEGAKRQPWCFKCVSDQTPIYPDWIISDMRFINEMQAIIDRKGVTIRVIRGEQNIESLHESETALDDFKMDFTISNDGSLEELIEAVDNVLFKITHISR